MIYEKVHSMSRSEIDSHPLIDCDISVKEFLDEEEALGKKLEDNDYFTLFLILFSQKLYFCENDGENIKYLIELIKEKLTELLKYVCVEISTLYELGEYMQCSMLKLLLEFFWETEYRDIIIEGIMNLDDEYENERFVLDEFINNNYDDYDLMVFIVSHPSWRLFYNAIEDAIAEHPFLKTVFIGEGIDHIIDEFDLKN